METNCIHPIRYVAKHTGLKPYLIRTWEERYRAVCPQRTAGNRRLYSDKDVHRLKLLKRAVDCGHNISTVSALEDKNLAGLVERARTGQPLPGLQQSFAINGPKIASEATNRQTIAQALDCIAQLDAPALERVLGAAAVDLTRQAFILDIIVPLFERIGDLWRAGKLKTVGEHMASLMVRSILWDMLRTVAMAEGAPRIVVATPVGHWHEFGALVSALAAAESGWQPLYFGPNLPSEEIVYAVRKREARALSLSLSHRLNDNKLSVELGRMRRALPPHIPIFVGGLGAIAARRVLDNINAVVVDDLQTFRDRLENLMRDVPS